MAIRLHFIVEPPYVVLRRVGRVLAEDEGDREWFVGHRARVWMQWRKPWPKWETRHLATHDELYRFYTREEAEEYIAFHGDMSGDGVTIEFVHVEISANREKSR